MILLTDLEKDLSCYTCRHCGSGFASSIALDDTYDIMCTNKASPEYEKYPNADGAESCRKYECIELCMICYSHLYIYNLRPTQDGTDQLFDGNCSSKGCEYSCVNMFLKSYQKRIRTQQKAEGLIK